MRAAQRFSDVAISGLAHLDAPHAVSSTEIEEALAPTLRRLRISPGLLEKLSGITERSATLADGSGAVAWVLPRVSGGHRSLGGMGRPGTAGNAGLCVGQADE